MDYTITFERVGRSRDVAPLDVTADDANEIAFVVYNYVRPQLASSDVEVVANLDRMRGMIYCGFRNGGEFTIAERDDGPDPATMESRMLRHIINYERQEGRAFGYTAEKCRHELARRREQA